MTPNETLATLIKEFESISTLLKKISSLDRNRAKNITQIRATLLRLQDTTDRLSQEPNYFQLLSDWIVEYSGQLEETVEQNKQQFGVQLETELAHLNLPLSGHYPDLHVNFFTLEVNFDKSRVTLWYGPKQEKLGQCALSVSEVVQLVNKTKSQLGSNLEEDQLLQKLQEAYSSMSDSVYGEPVPIIPLLSRLVYVLQSSQFHQDPRTENFKGYSRADFSFDLFRIRHILGLNLVVATRAYTRSRQDFLWIPDDEKSGKGTVYSHIQVKNIP